MREFFFLPGGEEGCRSPCHSRRRLFESRTSGCLPRPSWHDVPFVKLERELRGNVFCPPPASPEGLHSSLADGLTGSAAAVLKALGRIHGCSNEILSSLPSPRKCMLHDWLCQTRNERHMTDCGTESRNCLQPVQRGAGGDSGMNAGACHGRLRISPTGSASNSHRVMAICLVAQDERGRPASGTWKRWRLLGREGSRSEAPRDGPLINQWHPVRRY